MKHWTADGQFHYYPDTAGCSAFNYVKPKSPDKEKFGGKLTATERAAVIELNRANGTYELLRGVE